jgi:zona occludens toxin
MTPDAGSLIIIDESHTAFPQRASGKAPPPWVEALTTHRHQGLDFWFVSQRPSFLDPFIRGLSSNHIHLSLNAFSFTGSRNKYEWSEYQETVNRTSKLLASKSDYKPSPAVFPLYASASVHTKLDQRMPTIMKVFLVMVVIICIMASLAVMRVKSHLDAINAPPLVQKESGVKPLVGGAGGERSAQTATATQAAPLLLAQAFETRPLISSCIANSHVCKCYTDKGVFVPMAEQECRANVQDVTDRFKVDGTPHESTFTAPSSPVAKAEG